MNDNKSIHSLLMEEMSLNEEYRLPYMKVRKEFKFFGTNNPSIIKNILETNIIAPSQYSLIKRSSNDMEGAVYFTDDLGRAFNWYATKRSDITKDIEGEQAYVFSIDPDKIDYSKVYFDTVDFYIAILGILVFKMQEKGKETDNSKLKGSVGIRDGRIKIDISANLSKNSGVNRLWNTALNAASNIVENKINNISTPIFDILRNVDDSTFFTFRIKGKQDLSYMRYDKVTSFGAAKRIYDKLYRKDKDFVEWVDNMEADIIAGLSPHEHQMKYSSHGAIFCNRYQRSLVRFIKEFCSSFAYRGSLEVYGFFTGSKKELLLPQSVARINHVTDRYLKITENPRSVNEITKAFFKVGLQIQFKYTGKL